MNVGQCLLSFECFIELWLHSKCNRRGLVAINILKQNTKICNPIHVWYALISSICKFAVTGMLIQEVSDVGLPSYWSMNQNPQPQQPLLWASFPTTPHKFLSWNEQVQELLTPNEHKTYSNSLQHVCVIRYSFGKMTSHKCKLDFMKASSYFTSNRCDHSALPISWAF